ncbi:hypothetical protein C8Q70DRAFT_184474 [Cubamyces menziesii]|uniref:DUF7770 domain-containing protein n=1 Tax=Trametes cubensis TaxID=1111947 RepID=A0AAD7U2U9_9APHY|nr:hypothetical protein C8Q70DRAFT_184474 [Cubamyces menziesii]KAJ8495053.1 hypothetical protein ONZ51_g1933 [Trametes cubensis]
MNPPPKPFDIAQWQKKDRGVIVQRFVASAVKMPGQTDPTKTKTLLHWRGGGAYKLGLSGRSTSYDTRKDGSDPVIEVQLISKDFEVSRAAPYYWDTLLAKEYTTTQIYELMVARNFNRYMYNGNGSGCLTWTTALVQLLEDEDVLPPGSVAAFQAKVAQARADPIYWVPDEPGAHFY